MKRIEIKQVSSHEQLDKLRQPWNDLLDNAIRPTVFATWEWQSRISRIYNTDQKLEVLAAYSEGTLVGILPLCRAKTKIGNIIPTTVLRCLGGSLTDYNALLVKKKHLSPVIQAYASYLLKCKYPLDFENVLPGSPLYILGQHLARRQWYQAAYESKNALFTDLPSDYQNFLKTRKKKFKKTLRNNQNYMDRDGGYTYHVEPASSELLDELISLHTSRWQHKGGEGALAKQRIKEFHATLNKLENRPFDIRYFTICHHNKIAAILYGFTYRNRFYAYLSGFDMAHTRISPGNMIINHCLRVLINDGITVFDMLRGDMKYKQTWATKSYDMKDVIYFPPVFSGWLMYRTMKTIQFIKRMIPASLKKRLKSLLHRGTVEAIADD